MMICHVCESRRCRFLKRLEPYQDEAWHFEIFDCLNCGSRYAVRDPKINYHEVLHAMPDSSYTYHYDIAEKVKAFLEAGRIDECERYLRKASYKYAEVIDFVGKKKPLSILEIGCSTGFMTALFRARGYEAEGIDISETAIHYAVSSFGPFYALRLPEKNYDLIFHLGVIGCVDHPRQLLLDSLELLTAHGEMIFNAPNVHSPKQLGELWVSTPPPDLVCLFHETSFQTMLAPAFTVEIKKIYSKKEGVQKHMKKVFWKQYANYPIRFRNDRKKGEQGMVHGITRRLRRVIGFCFEIFLTLRILKQYESEYGLIVSVRRRGAGTHD